MNEEIFSELLAFLHKVVRVKLTEAVGGHDLDHTLRVLHNAEVLASRIPEANLQVVQTAALLHDIARPEEHDSNGGCCHAQLGAEVARALLTNLNAPEEFINHVSSCVRTHRYRDAEAPQTIEAKIVYDADKLDSLGAIGLGRAFLFAGSCNARLHNTQEEALNNPAYGREDTAYREYLVKLRHLPECLQTQAGLAVAEERLTYMAEFFKRLEQEIEGVL